VLTYHKPNEVCKRIEHFHIDLTSTSNEFVEMASNKPIDQVVDNHPNAGLHFVIGLILITVPVLG
jgi:hypothetical protein